MFGKISPKCLPCGINLHREHLGSPHSVPPSLLPIYPHTLSTHTHTHIYSKEG